MTKYIEDMTNKVTLKTNIIYGLSVALILCAIIFVAILGKVQNKGSSSDVRARASNNSGVIVDGTVNSIDPSTNTMIVDSIHFPESDPTKIKSMGTWTVTLPIGYDTGDVYAGVNVKLMMNPATFMIPKKTATAIKIEVTK